MRRKCKIIALASLAFVSIAAVTASTLAWFGSFGGISFGTDADNVNVSGGSIAEHYKSGHGTVNDPYIIATRNHLYNLAWLQYLGFYNDPARNNVGIQQKYFEIEEGLTEIDCLGLTLPPIGTETFPFLGHFDGNGCVIKNFTISNDNPSQAGSDFGVAKPSQLYNGQPSEIVGFFGVVGKLPDQNISYTSSIVSIENVTFKDFTVKSETSQTLIGLAAGYVDGTMSGVKVDGNATLDVDGQRSTAKTSITSNLSDYGLVGYSTKIGNKGDFTQKLSEFYHIGKDTDGGWGGSIHMAGLYNRLNAYEEEYYSTYTGHDDIAGKTYAGKVNSWLRRDGDRDFHYLAGTGGTIGSGQTRQTQMTYTVSQNETQNAFYISAGSNYLSISDSGEEIEVTTSPKTLWRFSNDTYGYLFTVMNSVTWQLSGNRTVSRDNVVRYLDFTNGVLRVCSLSPDFLSSNAQWTINGSNQIANYNNSAEVLCFNGADWVVRNNGVGESGYKLYFGTNRSYLGVTTSAFTYGLSSNEAAIFTVTSANKVGGKTATGTTRYFYYRNNAYVPYTSSPGTAHTMSFFSSPNQNTTISASDGAYLGQVVNNRDYYRVKFSNGSFIRETGNANNSESYVRLEEYSENITASSVTSIQNVNKVTWTIGEKISDTETYIPLNIANNSLAATTTNVGYIVSGSNYQESAYRGDIRVSRYDYSELSSSIYGDDVTLYTINNYNGSTAVRTIADTLDTDDTSTAASTIESYGLTKYYDYTSGGNNVTGARTAFFETLNSDKRNVYGLHFMNASVDENNVFAATNVRINEQTYASNYDLPRDCVDVNLKENGIITFFAGTYFNVGGDFENNCFFSLSEVTRNGTSISDINQIYKIYENNSDHSIVYTYNSSATYSTDDYTLKFDVEWISNTNSSYWHNNSIYYFEIPVKAGEYALGSVSTNGKNGAYLMYLDIAADGSTADTDNISAYSITTISTANDYPKGVDFIPISVSGNGGDTIAFSIASGNKGVLTIAVSSSNISFTDSSSIAAYSYRNESNYAASNPASSEFTCNLSGAPPSLTTGGTRVLNIFLKRASDDAEYEIRITDVLSDTNGTIGSSTFEYKLASAADFSTVPGNDNAAKINYIENTLSTDISVSTLRGLTIATTLERASGENEFAVTYDMTGCSYANKTIAVTLEKNGSTVDAIVTANYTLVIGANTYTGGDSGTTYRNI